jgi:hypothetical protein
MGMLGLQTQYLQSCYDFMIPSTSVITVHFGTALAKGVLGCCQLYVLFVNTVALPLESCYALCCVH